MVLLISLCILSSKCILGNEIIPHTAQDTVPPTLRRGPTCVHNQNTIGLTLFCIILFSIGVQMAEGLHFGIVPYISRPALGVVSGMVGAGGNAGALISGQFIVSAANPLDDGFIRLGFVIIVLSLSMHAIYFPDEGGILLPPGLKYDPQLVKAEKGQKGADELDFTKTKGGDNVSV